MLNPAPAARAVKPGVGARALYLGSREPKRVSCTAEALVVTNARAQTLRYPVARVARVVSSADVVDWSGTALALCMRAGIGITWLDARGHALGSLYPQHRTVAPLATALELWIENEDGLTRYHHWLRSRRMDIFMRWGKSRANAISPQHWEATKREWVYAGQYPLHLPPGLRHLLLAYVATQLGSYGLTPQLWGPQVQGVHLDDDLCELLWADMNLSSGPLPDKLATEPELNQLFERWSMLNASALTVHLNSLHRTALKEGYP